MPPRPVIAIAAAPQMVRVVGAPAGAAPAPAAPSAAEAVRAKLEAERQGLAHARQALEAAVAQVQALQDQIVRAAEAQLVDLALAVAEKVLAQEIEGGRYRLEPIVREVLGRLPTDREIVLRLNPQDLAAWQQSAPDAATMPANLRLVADPSLRRADCRAETAEGFVPAAVADRLREAAEILKRME